MVVGITQAALSISETTGIFYTQPSVGVTEKVLDLTNIQRTAVTPESTILITVFKEIKDTCKGFFLTLITHSR